MVGPTSANVAAIVQQINRQLNGVKANVQINVQNVTKSLSNVSKHAKKATSDMEAFGQQAALAIRRYGAFTLATGGFIKLTQAISSGIDEAIKFDREVVRVAQVTGQSVKSLTGLTKEITKLSTSLGVSSADLIKVSSTLAQAGLNAKETKVALEALAKTGVSATFGDINDTTEASIAIMQQFNLTTKDLESTLSSINKVSAAFAVESEDISVAVRRAGGAFEAAGGNLNEFIALFTSVRQTTRESAESIATGFRTIFTRLQRLKTQDYFKQLGIDLRNAEGQFVGPYEAIRKISDALKGIESTDPQFSQIVEELGGFRQVSKVVPLLQQFAVSEKALQVAMRGGTSLSEDAAAAQDALAIKLQRVKEEFADLIRTITSNTAFRGLVESTLELSTALIKLTKSLEPLLPLLATFGAVAIGGSVGKFTKGFKSKIFGFSSGGMVPGQGNQDTVPAMLTPGEFVLTKKTVEKLGARKFATGNKVLASQYKTKNDLVKALLDVGYTETMAGKVGNRFEGIGGAAAAQKLIDEKTTGTPKQKLNKDGTVQKTISFDGSGFSMLRPTIGGREEIDINNQAGVIAKASSSSSARQKVLSILQSAGINRGDKLSGKITSYGLSKKAAGAIDTKIEKLFRYGVEKVVDETLGDGKIINPQKPPPLSKLISTSAINSVKGQFFEAVIRRASSDFLKGGVDPTFDFGKSAGGQTTHGNLDVLFGEGVVLPADAKGGNINKAKLKMVNKAIRQFGSSIFKGRKFADGGSVGGSGNSDTVPALLTPGEFVVTKKAAQNIGYGNLKKINKYASGGKVGGAISGTLSNPIASIGIFTVLQSLSGNLLESNKELKGWTDKIIESGVRFAALITVVKGASTQVNQFSGKLGVFSSKGFSSSLAQNSFVTGLFGHTIRSTAGLSSPHTISRVNRLNKRDELIRQKAIGSKVAIGSGVAIGAGAIGGVFGDSISSSANEKLARGVDARGEAKLGGTLSGIGTGAAIGSIFGPFGIAIGAAVGGIYGFTTSLSSAEKALKEGRFAQRMDDFTTKLSEFSKGRLSTEEFGRSAREEISASFKDLVQTTSSDDKKNITSNFKQKQTEIEEYFRNVAKSSRTMDDFNNAVGKSLVQYAVLIGVPFKQLEQDMQKLIGTQQKEIAAAASNARAKTEEVRRVQNLVTLMNAFENAVSGIEKFSTTIDNFINLLGGDAIPEVEKTADVFKKAAEGKGVPADVSKQALEIARVAGLNNPEAFAKEAADRTNLISQLPAIVDAFRKTSPDEISEPVETIRKIAAGRLGVDVKSDIIDNLGKAVDKELGPAKDTQGLIRKADLPDDLADKLRTEINSPLQTMGEAASALDTRTKIILDKTKKIAELTAKEVDIRLEVLNRLQDFNEREDELRGKTPTFKSGLANLDAKLLTASGRGLGTDFAGEIDKLNLSISKLQENPVINKDELLQQQIQLQNLHKAQDILIHDTMALAAGFKELEEEEKKRRFKGDIVGTAVFGGLDERQQFTKTFLQTAIASKAGNLNAVPFDDRRSIEGFLKSAGKEKIGGTPANEILEKLVRADLTQQLAAVVGPKAINSPENQKKIEEMLKFYLENGLTEKQEKLINEMRKFVESQNKAQTDIGGTLTAGAKDIRDALVTANNIFLSKLEQIFKEEKNQENKAKKEDNDEKIRNIDQVKKNLGELGIDASQSQFIDLTSSRKKANQLETVGNTSMKFDELLTIQNDAYDAIYPLLDALVQNRNNPLGESESSIRKRFAEMDAAGNLDGVLSNSLINDARKEKIKQARTPEDFKKVFDEIRQEMLSSTGISENDILDKRNAQKALIQASKINEMVNNISNSGFTSTDKINIEQDRLTKSNESLKVTMVQTNTEISTLQDAIIKNTEQLNNVGKNQEELKKERDAKAEAVKAAQEQANKAEQGNILNPIVSDELGSKFERMSGENIKKNLRSRKKTLSDDNFVTNNPEQAAQIQAEIARLEYIQDNRIAANNAKTNNRNIVSQESKRNMLERLGLPTNATPEQIRIKEAERRNKTLPLDNADKARGSRIAAEEERLGIRNKPSPTRINAPIRDRKTVDEVRNQSIANQINKLIDAFEKKYNTIPASEVQESWRKILRSGGRVKFATGGFVPGIGSGDTVPAMLTPGEFVMNKKSSESIGYSNLARMNKYAAGGIVTPNQINLNLNPLDSIINRMNASIESLGSALDKIPTSITMTGNHKVEVVVNGADAFSRIQPMVQDLILVEINKSLNNFIDSYMPNVQRQFNTFAGKNTYQGKDKV